MSELGATTAIESKTQLIYYSLIHKSLIKSKALPLRSMKKQLILAFLFAFLLITQKGFSMAADSLTRNGYTLTFDSNDPNFDSGVKQKLINTFFEVYPKEAKTFNKKTLKTVCFFVDTAYKGVAYANDGKVVFSAAYMRAHPTDIDVVTHEVMHIVQNYGKSTGPWWITEGIADYVRYTFGVDNAGAGWKLPDYKPTQNYDNSYRVTARFLVWIEAKVKKGTVKKLDSMLRDHTFTDNSWKDVTGKTVDELWKAYSENPVI